jgi:hypothetical protein
MRELCHKAIGIKHATRRDYGTRYAELSASSVEWSATNATENIAGLL